MAARHKPEPIDPAVVAGWHSRRGTLLAKLHAEPDGMWAWLWQMHLDIVDYLIHRYADAFQVPENDGGPCPSAEAASAGVQSHQKQGDTATPDLPGLHGSARVAKAASLEGPAAVRLRKNLRGRLSSLHTTNDERRASQPPIRPTPPPPPYRPLFATLFLPPEKIQRVVRTTFPEDGWWPLDDEAEVEPFDDTSLALFRQAIAYDQGWDLEAAEALTEDEVLRLLLSEDDGPQAEDTAAE